MKNKILKLNGYELVITQEVDNLLNNYQSFYTPKREDVFKAYELTAFSDVKVVIIGQDPYPTKDYAMGLSFSVNKDCEIPKSLKNMFRVLEQDLGIIKNNGDLSSWSKQGILLINSVLSTEINKSNVHKNIGYEKLTSKVISDLSSRGRVIFVLLGNYAKKYEHLIDEANNNIILKTSHPSPLGAYRGFNDFQLFKKINQSLTRLQYLPIEF